MVIYAKEQGMLTGGYGDELEHGFEECDTSMMAIGGVGGNGDTAGRRGNYGDGYGDRHDRPKYGPETNKCTHCDSFFCSEESRVGGWQMHLLSRESKKKEYGIAEAVKGAGATSMSRAPGTNSTRARSKKLKGLNFKTVKDAVKEHDDKSGGIIPSVGKEQR